MPVRLTLSLYLCLLCGAAGAQNAIKLPGVEPPESIAAKVNDDPITVGEIDAVLRTTLRGATLTNAQHRELRRALLEDLIDEKLLRQFLDKEVHHVETAVLDAQMTALKASLLKENSTLEEFLRRTNGTEAQLRDEWKARLQLAHYVKRLASDEKLKAYHAANRDHFDRVEVRVSHVLIRVSKDAPPIDRAAAREKLQRVRAELVGGQLSFAAAARKYSQCSSALKNGDLGFLPRRGLPEDEPLAKAAFALRVGEVSAVIESDRGFHLLTATDRKPGTPSVLENCVIEVLDAFTEDTRSELIRRLRKEGKVQIMLR